MSKMKSINPFGEQVLCEEIAPTNISTGGIIIPSTAISKTNQGTVVDKGPMCSDKILTKDVVFFPMHSEARLEMGGRKFILVPESAILGAIREVESK